MPDSPKTFVINRSKWFRGKGATNSRLLTASGLMCCLGQIGEQCGIAPDILRYKTSPSVLPSDECNKYPTCFFVGHQRNSDLTCRAMSLNDNSSLLDEDREQRLIDLFAEKGITLTFVDKIDA